MRTRETKTRPRVLDTGTLHANCVRHSIYSNTQLSSFYITFAESEKYGIKSLPKFMPSISNCTSRIRHSSVYWTFNIRISNSTFNVVSCTLQFQNFAHAMRLILFFSIFELQPSVLFVQVLFLQSSFQIVYRTAMQ